MRERASVGCGVCALAAYAGALASLVHGYPYALDHACPEDAAAPVEFWPLLIAGVALAVLSFWLRPSRRGEGAGASGPNAFAVFIVIVVPLAAVATIVGYRFTYNCWE